MAEVKALRVVFGIVMALVGIAGLGMSACGGFFFVLFFDRRMDPELLALTGGSLVGGALAAWAGWVWARRLLRRPPDEGGGHG